MLEAIFDAVEYIADLLSTLGEFLIDTVVGIGELLANIPAIVSMLTVSISNLPSVVLPFATVSITVAVLLLTVGRNNN